MFSSGIFGSYAGAMEKQQLIGEQLPLIDESQGKNKVKFDENSVELKNIKVGEDISEDISSYVNQLKEERTYELAKSQLQFMDKNWTKLKEVFNCKDILSKYLESEYILYNDTIN